ncbi:MAG: hypothetical protein JJU28_17305 [Cyclobacteriaceae bacterium]|nr:hypothetical protein [Cyclobacteriaceae bacterium]
MEAIWMYLFHSINFGMVVLTWLVHWIAYPAFFFFRTEDLGRWHGFYSGRMVAITLPLMSIQGILSIWFLFKDFQVFTLAYFISVIATWVITFAYAVPYHVKISNAEDLNNDIKKLLRVNLLRSWVWTIIFLLGLAYTLL